MWLQKKSMSAAFSSAVAKFQRVDAEGQGDIRDKRDVTTWLLRLSKSSVSVRKIQWAGLVQIGSLLSPTADAG